MSSDEDEKFVIDIGGGSTEIIYGKGNEVIFKKSHPVGAVMLTEKFTEHDPPQKNEVRNIDKHLDDVFSRLTGKIPTGTPGIAVAGTPTSLSAMDKGLKEYDEEKIEASFLSYDSIKKLSETLLSLKSGDVLKNFGPVVKGREDVMFAGALILKKVSEILHTNGFTVSGKGIRYGAIVDYLKSID